MFIYFIPQLQFYKLDKHYFSLATYPNNLDGNNALNISTKLLQQGIVITTSSYSYSDKHIKQRK